MLTPKQESFARKYIETGNASEAYRLSYDAERMKPESIHRMAHDLLENLKVASRINELQAVHQKRHNVTVDSLTKEYEEARMAALADKQYSPVISAITGKAKLHGLIIDKVAGAKGEEPIAVALSVSTDEARRIKSALDDEC